MFSSDNTASGFGIISSAASAKDAVLDFFKTPQLPEGFEMAQPVSTFSAFASSIPVFFGFALNKPIAKKTSLSPSMPLPAAGTVRFDFDADGKADFARWRGSSGSWSVKKSSDNSTASYTLGSSSSLIVPADYDNDGKADYAVFNASGGNWTIRKSSTGTDQTLSGFGQSGDKPVVGDFDGDSKADPAVWRPSNGTWYIAQSSSSYSVVSTQFGQSGDIPVQGDYDGDGALDKAVFRPTGGYWYVLGTTSGFTGAQWGLSTDIPVPADYDGDNKTDYAVYRGSTGTWYAYKSSGTGQYIAQIWGNYGDQPVPADYDGDGYADFAVWRPKTGNWHVFKSCNYSGTCSQGDSYKYAQLGSSGDVPAEASYLKQIGSLVQGYELNAARLSPKNSTGGTDLYSRNFSWGTNLVDLPGRAGLNAGFGMSYNSLVWTKQGANIYFDADASNMSPGFRFGFPVIEPVYYDEDKDNFSYLMVSPSGARTEFRQLSGASDTYEPADSSYAQLKTIGATNPNDPAEAITITVTGTDGTKMSYEWKAGAFRCKKITDRNGNYIEINHDEYGVLRTIKDTLGRVITVYYDGDLYPTSIKQTWKNNNGAGSDVTHVWATFAYTTQEITTNFSSTAVANNYGPPNGTVLKVLQKVTFPTDTSSVGPHTVFSYNTWGQVKQITNYSADNTQLNYVKVNLPADASGSAQTDCPRFTETRSWMKNFNLQNNAEQEIVVNNSIDENQTYSLPGNPSGSATLIKVWMTGHPDNLLTKTFVGASGWKESLPLATEECVSTNCSGSDRKRWTWTEWTQDNTDLSYIQNPRVKETRVGDATNVRKSQTDYYPVSENSPVALYGLVKEVRVYNNNLPTILKKAVTEYNLDTAYTSRRIIGLPSQTEIYGFNDSSNQLELVSKMSYAYDEGDFTSDQTLEQNISSVIRHDNANYSASFVIGRGNLTSTKRWNVDPAHNAEFVTSIVKYNIAGAPVAYISPWNGNSTRQVRISYADNFNSTTTTGATYAYPTKFYDPAENYSEVKYRFDTGANVRAQSPAPDGQSVGKITTRIFDSAGRLQKESIWKNATEHAYTRYEYPANNVQSKVYSTVVDNDSDGADADDEVLSESWADGAGRVLRSRTEHPNSTNGWSGSLVEYDILGRVKRSTVPTEISVNTSTNEWTPAGDDAAGWRWTHKKYDWKGRVARIINTDGVDSPTLNDSDQLFSYEGCGCAGGEVVTIEGEAVPVPGQSFSARRKQKIYSDIFGRQEKTEIYEWNGTSVYTTTVNTFNGRDQITSTKQYAGTVGSSSREVTMTYDGYGRMKTRHFPIEDALAQTSWVYNPDDSVQQAIDPRGVIANFTYNLQGLVTNIDYQLPDSNPTNIPDTPDVTYVYDNAGNRIEMWDGLGSTDSPGVTYEYNELSQLTAETRYFADRLQNSPQNGYRMEYTYNLSGGLKSFTDPFDSEIVYTHDKTGRLTKVDGDAFADNTGGHYADNIKYRAFGQVKQMNYKTEDNALVSLAYDNRLRVSQYQVASSEATGGYLKKAQFAYLPDSNPQAMDDQINDNFDRTYQYDFAGRLTANQFGNPQASNYPYAQTIQYDRFSQITARATTHWQATNNITVAFTGTGRRQAVGFQVPVYDAAGNLLNSGASAGSGNYQHSVYDAANRQLKTATRYREKMGLYVYWTYENETTQSYDGDGRPLKIVEKLKRVDITPHEEVVLETKYQIWSSVLNDAVTEVRASGAKAKTKVYAGGAVIAEQIDNPVTDDFVFWIHADPVTGSSQKTEKSGQSYDFMRTELEPLGQEVMPIEPPQVPMDGMPAVTFSASEPEWLCQGREYSRMPVSCEDARSESIAESIRRAGNALLVSHEGGHFLSSSETAHRLPVSAAPIGKPHNNSGASNEPISIPASSVPSEDGCTANEEGKQNCVVNVAASADEVSSDRRGVQSFKKADKFRNKNKAINASLVDASTILSTQNDCSDFFGKYALKALHDLDKILEEGPVESSNEIGIRQSSKTKPPDVMGDPISIGNRDIQEKAYRVYDRATVNSNGPFFNPLAGKVGGYSATTRESRVLQILHELAHMIYKREKDGRYEYLILDDKGVGLDGQSGINTEIILSKCKAEIDKLNKSKKGKEK